MNSLIRLHTAKIATLIVFAIAIFWVNNWHADYKAMEAITWIDIFGEASMLGFMLIFLFFIINTRPRGRITSFVGFGLVAFSLAIFQDVLDEIFQLPPNFWFADILESVLSPIAVLAISYGFYLWNQEQQLINNRFKNKERYYREHSAIDPVTDLYTALYMHDQLEREIMLHANEQQPFSLLMIDISDFSQFNALYGDLEGDRLLRHVASLITLNLRASDLACRYAADRFVVLFPCTHRIDASAFKQELEQALQKLAFKPRNSSRSVFINSNSALVDHRDAGTADQVLLQLSKQLDHTKQKNRATRQVA